MRKTVLGLVVGLVAFVMAADDSVTGVGAVRLSGRLGERLEQVMRNHVLATDADALAAVFKEKTERRGFWQTEYWGKYMHAANAVGTVPAIRYFHESQDLNPYEIVRFS